MYEGNRIELAGATIRGIVDIDSSINDKGIHLHFLNEPDSTGLINSAADFDKIWAGVRFSGRTRIGNVLRDKVWKKILDDPAHFTKPCLVYMITDGEVRRCLSFLFFRWNPGADHAHSRVESPETLCENQCWTARTLSSSGTIVRRVGDPHGLCASLGPSD